VCVQDWICPAYNRLLSELLVQYHGQITAEVGIHYISAMEQSGSNRTDDLIPKSSRCKARS
jgi:hypothetical protein